MPLERLVLCIIVVVLIGTGIVMIYNSTDILAGDKYGDGSYYLKKQLVCFALGIAAFFVAAAVNYQILVKFGSTFLVFSVLLLVLVLYKGDTVNGATRWVNVFGIRIQPAEAASYSTILFLVYMLSKKQRKVHKFLAVYVPTIAGTGVVLSAILLQPNLSVTLLIGGTALILLYIGGVRARYIILTVLAAFPFLILFVINSDYLMDRIRVWWDPFKYAGGKGLQPVESMTALGVGGWLGVGLGMSRQKLYFLPYCHNDFIGAIIGEETGFVGMMVLLALYIGITICGIVIAYRIKDLRGYLLASGITVLISLQALIHIGVITNSIPPTGINLPFISFGGSNLVMNCAGIGMLVNISRRTELQPREKFAVQNDSGQLRRVFPAQI